MRVAPRPRVAGRTIASVWLGRGMLFTMLFLLLSICHGAVLPGQTMAAPSQEHLPVHVPDCAVDVEAAAPSPLPTKVMPSAQPVRDPLALALRIEPLSGLPDAVPVDSPAVRRARLQLFLI